jgi:hypothetical protein
MIIAVDHPVGSASLLGYKGILPVWVCTNVEAVSGPRMKGFILQKFILER